MTQSSKHDVDRLPSMTRGLTLATIALMALSLTAVSGCDTVAELPFSDRELSTVHTGAFGPVDSGECGAIEHDAILEMVLLDNQSGGLPIREGDDDMRVMDSVELDTDNFEFRGGMLYSFPDQHCESSDDCHGNLSCGGDDLCEANSDVNQASILYGSDNEPESQAYAVAMADVGTWNGHLHGDLTGNFSYDRDSGEVIDEVENTPMDTALGVDPDEDRTVAARDAAEEWTRLNEFVIEEGERDAHFGFWTFDSSIANVRSRVEDDSDSVWTQDSTEARTVLNDYSANEPQSRLGVYESLIEVLRDGFQDPSISDVEQGNLVVIVPGHDELRTAPRGPQDVIDEVESISDETGIDISVSIIQVDTNRDLTVDDFEYYEEQQECSSDTDCKNFESCREPTWYVDNDNDPGVADVVKPDEDDRDTNFCLPDYDDNGRLGPIADYNQVACETGGSYHYVPQISRSQVEEPMSAAVWSAEAVWELGVRLERQDRLSEGQQREIEPYMVETELDVNLGRQRTVEFIRDGGGADDTRRVFFSPDDLGDDNDD